MENKCKNCGVDIQKNRKFCSKSCAAIHNNSLHPKRTNGRIKPDCKNCGKKLDTFQKVYCNNKCQQEYFYKEISIPKILNGEVINSNTKKKYLKETVLDKCSECGVGEIWQGKLLTLQIDHIDGNSDNNNLSNLRLLCPNCHSQTETYGSKGNGSRYKKKTKRNEYLRKYKSY